MLNRIKDQTPLKTVNDIRECLTSVDLFTYEKWELSNEGTYSVHISIPNSSIFSNGKGSTMEYALASGYGELVERLQNFAYFRMKKIKHFDYSIDKYVIYKNIKTSITYVRKFLVDLGIPKDILTSLLELWEIILNREGDDVKFFEYVSENGEMYILPEIFVNYYFGTNGMSAGNSIEEAKVQAYSEIIERYINKKMLFDKLSPPRIDINIFSKFPEIMNIYNYISNSINHRIEILDLSLGKGIPAIGIILYDLSNQKYFVKVGVHFNIEVALERCLTELLQGKTLRNFWGMSTINNVDDNNQYNRMSIFQIGKGNYPKEIFLSTPSYKSNIIFSKYENNTDGLEYLESVISELGYSIYENMDNFLVLYSIHALVPNMSEVNDYEDINSLKDYCDYRHFLDCISDLTILKEDELDFVIDFVESRYAYGSSTTLLSLIDTSFFNGNSFYGKIRLDFFLYLLYLKKAKHKTAMKYLTLYIDSFRKEKNTIHESRNYYFCSESYLKLINSKLDLENTVDILNRFYKTDLVKEVIEDYKCDPFQSFPKLKCSSSCLKCTLQSNCTYTNDQEILNKVLLLKSSKIFSDNKLVEVVN